MRLHLLLILGVGLLLVVAPRKEHVPNKDDAENIEGVWKPVEIITDGKPATEELLKEERTNIIVGDQMVVGLRKDTNAHVLWAYRLDSAQNPKTIDMVMRFHWYLGEQQTFPGIYSLEGDVLKICMSGPGDKRPTEFASKPGSTTVLWTLKRQSGPPGSEERKKLLDEVNRASSRSSLWWLQIALNAYKREHDDRYPPPMTYSKDGKPLLSWRVVILPYLNEKSLFNEFKLDEPWDSPHNKKLLARMPAVYAPVGVTPPEPHSTFYQVFVGPHTLFEADAKGISGKDASDYHTVLVVEAGEAAPWTKPADLPYAANKRLPALGGLFPDGFHMALHRHGIRFVKSKFNESAMRLAIVRDDGEDVNLDELDRK